MALWPMEALCTSFKKSILKVFFIIIVCICVYVPWLVCDGQRAICRLSSLLLPYPEFESWLSGLHPQEARAFYLQIHLTGTGNPP